MIEISSLEKMLPKADRESGIVKQTILRRLQTINAATDQEHFLDRPFVVTPAPLHSVIEKVEAPEQQAAPVLAPETQPVPIAAQSAAPEHTVVYSSERNAFLQEAQRQVQEAYSYEAIA